MTFLESPIMYVCFTELLDTSSKQPRRTDSNLLADGTFPIVVGSCRINEDMKAAHMDWGAPWVSHSPDHPVSSSGAAGAGVGPSCFNGYVGYVAKSATVMKHDET